MYRPCLQSRGATGAAAESQTGRLLRPADWSNSWLQRGSSQRAEAQSWRQTLGQTGEHIQAFFLFIFFIAFDKLRRQR